MSSSALPATICPPGQDAALCGLLAATDIELQFNWMCTTAGFTVANPCVVPWNAVTCTSGKVVAINLNNVGLTGTVPTALGNHYGLTRISLASNKLFGM